MRAEEHRPSGLHLRRVPLLLLGAGALFAGLWTGLSRLGAVSTPLDAMAHGPLMVSGFLGTVISLERAVAARAAWAFSAPLLCGVGAAALLLGQPVVGAVLLSAGSAVVLVVLTRVWLSSPLLHHGVLVLAAVSWLLGNVLLAFGRPVFQVVVLWVVFLVGTIAAERLELTRLLPRTPRTVVLFQAALGLMVSGALLSLWQRDLGMRVLGAGELGLSVWLLRFDVARNTVRQQGLVRFIALALLSGYVWLALAGGLGLAFGNPVAGPRYDAILHATFVGFVFSMIFGHAPIIVPAVLGVRVPFHARFYVHLGLLHASLVLRLAGDVFNHEPLRRSGSWGNTAAIVVFLGSTALAAAMAGRKR